MDGDPIVVPLLNIVSCRYAVLHSVISTIWGQFHCLFMTNENREDGRYSMILRCNREYIN